MLVLTEKELEKSIKEEPFPHAQLDVETHSERDAKLEAIKLKQIEEDERLAQEEVTDQTSIVY